MPHRGTGAELLMNRMFLGYPSDSVYALTTSDAARASFERGGAVPSANVFTAPQYQIHRRIFWRLGRVISWLVMPWIVLRAVQLLKRFEITAIFTVPWNQFCAAAYFTHRITGCALYVYAMDDPAGSHATRFRSPIYAVLMPKIMRAARRVWGVSDGMCEHLAKTYGVKCLPLLPTADIESFASVDEARSARPASDPFRIVYTGSVYGAQLEALQRFVRVLASFAASPENRLPEIQFTLFTTASRRYLAKIGLQLPANVNCVEVRHEEIPRVLAEADAAFLPLSFDPAQRHVVETSFPSKIAEYLASGIPILAHAPPSSTVARYCRENDCALLVDTPDDSALRDAVIRIATDAALRHQLSDRERELAHTNHDAKIVVAKFLNEMSEAQD